jgi:hypothetical protein
MFSLGVGGERDTENYGSKLTRRVTWALLHHRIGDTLVSVRAATRPGDGLLPIFLTLGADQHLSVIDLCLASAHCSPMIVIDSTVRKNPFCASAGELPRGRRPGGAA